MAVFWLINNRTVMLYCHNKTMLPT